MKLTMRFSNNLKATDIKGGDFCPTCGRNEMDAERIARAVELKVSHIKEPINSPSSVVW
ncbi:MAG TPA: hypothetical protein VI387_12895 [Candidatus Brocadiales bacterium]|nr:hypothetical protein [Candidatus Brocadiales bacterium]